MMGDLNSALNSVYNHLNAYSPSSIQQSAEALHKDNAMLQGMQEHSLDAEGFALAQKIQTQVANLQQQAAKPSLGAQQMTVSRWHKELKETRDRIKQILERTPKPSRSIEKNYKPKT